MTGGHLRFPEIGVLTALVAALLLRTGAPEGKPDPDLAAPKRSRAVLVVAGILASLLAAWPTRKPEAAFREEPWMGLHRPERGPKGEIYRWMGPAALIPVHHPFLLALSRLLRRSGHGSISALCRRMLT